MRIHDRCVEMFDNFAMQYPDAAEDAVDWYRSGRHEITVIRTDGSKLVYDDTRQTIRYITLIGRDSLEDGRMPEDRWAREFGIRVRKKMDICGLRNADLSDATRISLATISKYLNGRNLPSLYNITKIADALQCSVSELIDFD